MLDLLRGAERLPQPWAMKKVIVVPPACGVHPNHPKLEQHPGKGRRQPGHLTGHPTLQPSRDRQCETRMSSWQEGAEKHNGSKCDLPWTLCRECVWGTCPMHLHGILSCSSVSKAPSVSPDTKCSAPFRANFGGQQTESCPQEERSYGTELCASLLFC